MRILDPEKLGHSMKEVHGIDDYYFICENCGLIVYRSGGVYIVSELNTGMNVLNRLEDGHLNCSSIIMIQSLE